MTNTDKILRSILDAGELEDCDQIDEMIDVSVRSVQERIILQNMVNICRHYILEKRGED